MKHERMKITSQHIIRILAVILMMAGGFGGGNRAYAISGNGSPDNPYQISSADDWKYFKYLTHLNRSSFFILTNDIEVDTMFGVKETWNGYFFIGEFDGKGHTLTFKMGSESAPYGSEYCAPFHSCDNATIRNLKVKGEIVTSKKFASGIVAYGSVKIMNCISNMTIRSTVDGDGTHGGFIANSTDSSTIKDCIFNGQLLGRETHSCGGLAGWCDLRSGNDISYCIFDPQAVNFKGHESATFSRVKRDDYDSYTVYLNKLSNNYNYYKTPFGELTQGTDARGWTDPKMYDNIKSSASWVLHCDTLYLMPFQRYVDITGWASGSSANDKFPKKVEGTRSNKDVIYSYYKFGETSTLPNGAPTEKGHYTVKASVKAGDGNDSHKWPAWESTMHFCVYDPPTKVERDYDASNTSLLTDKGSIDVGTFYYRFKKDGGSYGDWSTDVPSATEQGTYYIDYYIKGNGTHNDIGSEGSPAGTITSKINIKSVVGDDLTVTFDPASYTYDGTAKQPAVTVKKGNNEVNSSEYKVAYSNNTNAGTATVTITDNKADGNYDIAQTTKSFTIEKEQLKATVTAKTLTYSGEAQELVSGSLSGTNTANCSIKYSSDGTNYTSTIPKGREAKTYTVYYKAEGDSNHKGTDAATVEVTISAKKVDNPMITITPSSFTYDGTEKKPDVKVYDGTTEIDKSEYTVSYSSNTNAGTATVTITDVDGGNYAVSGTGSFTILSEGSTYTPPTVKSGLVYNGTEQELLTAGSTTTGTMQYSSDGKTYSTDIPKGIDAKTYTVYYKVVGDGNHKDTSPVSLTVTIGEKTVSSPVITLSESSYVYDGKAKEPTVTVKDGETEISAAEYSVSYSDNVSVGTAKVTITDKDGGNYHVSGSTTFKIVDADAEFTAPAAKTGLVYNGKAQELVTAGHTKYGTLRYSSDGTNYSTSIPTGTDAKTYTVYYKVDGDGNHKGTDAATVEVTISAKKVTNPTTTVNPSSFTYDGTEKKPDVAVFDGETEIDKSEYTVSYSNNTNVGTATVTITDKDGGNYNVSGTGSFTILSEGSTYTPPTAKSGLVYNGTEQELLTAGSTTTGTMQYSSDGKTYITDIPKGIDAKTYTVYYKVVGDGNHKDSSPVSLTVTISQKTVSSPVITVSPSSYYYDGTAKKPSVTVKDGETEISSSEYTVGYTDNTNIGTATVIISDNDGGNYRVSGTANFSIVDPEKGETPMAKSDLVYNGSAQELITSGKATEGNKMVYSLDGSNYSSKIPTGTNARTYTVYFKEVDAKNKDATSASSLKVTISPKTISITVKVSDNGNNRPILTITDSEGNKLSLDDLTLTYRNAAGKEIDSGTSILQPGDYTVTIKPKGNYTGSSITKSFRITAAVSFVFTLESDVMSVCLPYDCSVPSGYHLYYFDRVNEKGYPVFKRILTKKMGAGKPYLLRYAGSSSSTRGSRTVDLSPSNPALVDFSTSIEMEYNDGMLFKGTFEQINSIMAHADGDYVLQADNTWILPDDEGMDVISLEPFHAYLRYEDRSTPVSVMGMVMMATTDTDEIYTTDPDHPTGLDQIEFDDDTEQWYDLQGRRLDGPQRGVNIIRKSDGSIRKVVKK